MSNNGINIAIAVTIIIISVLSHFFASVNTDCMDKNIIELVGEGMWSIQRRPPM